MEVAVYRGRGGGVHSLARGGQIPTGGRGNEERTRSRRDGSRSGGGSTPRAIKLAYAHGPGADSRLTPRGEEHDRPNESSCRVEDYIIDAALTAKEEQPLRSLYPQ
jgi:hypothetical protein